MYTAIKYWVIMIPVKSLVNPGEHKQQSVLLHPSIRVSEPDGHRVQELSDVDPTAAEK